MRREGGRQRGDSFGDAPEKRCVHPLHEHPGAVRAPGAADSPARAGGGGVVGGGPDPAPAAVRGGARL